MAGGVAELVERGPVVGAGARELSGFRENDLVGPDVVVGAVAGLVPDVDAAGVDDRLGLVVGLPLGLRGGRGPRRQPARLLGVEDGVHPDDRPAPLDRLPFVVEPGVPLVVFRLLGAGGEEEDLGALLSLLDVSAGLLDLAVGCPAVVGVAPVDGLDAQVEAVASPVGASGGEVLGEGPFSGLPGFLPRRGSGFDLLDDLVGELLVVVADSVSGPGHQLARSGKTRSRSPRSSP